MTTALLTDFPDALSPMVVKELRQGMRTRLFAGVMLVLHALMLVITLISGAAEDARDVDGLRTSLTVLVLCMIFPLRGFSALAGEIQKNTMDMLVLTRLSAWRIVFGKWASLAAQSTLVAVSLLPYVVARYLYGAQDLLADVAMLGLYWIIGLVITAAVVCLSTQKAFWLRAAVVGMFSIAPLFMGLMFAVGSVFGGGSGMSTTFNMMFGGSGLFSGGAWWVFMVTVLAAVWAVFFFLSLAATRVAPPSENLATVKRCVHGGLVFLLIGLSIWDVAPVMPAAFITAAVGVLYFAALDALTERNPEMTSIYLPFYRRGLLGRWMAWFLSPGWMTGVLFSFVAASLILVRIAYEAGTGTGAGSAENYLGLLSVNEVWMIAALVLVTSGRRSRDLLGPWIVIYILMGVIGALVSAVSLAPAAMGDQTPWGLCLLPGSTAAGYEMAQPDDKELFLMISAGTNLIWPLILVALAMVAAVKSKSLRKEARELAASVVER